MWILLKAGFEICFRILSVIRFDRGYMYVLIFAVRLAVIVLASSLQERRLPFTKRARRVCGEIAFFAHGTEHPCSRSHVLCPRSVILLSDVFSGSSLYGSCVLVGVFSREPFGQAENATAWRSCHRRRF